MKPRRRSRSHRRRGQGPSSAKLLAYGLGIALCTGGLGYAALSAYGKPIPDAAAQSVMTFLLLFAFSFMVIAIVLSAYGLDFLTAMSAAAQVLANVGPGLGDIIGPSGNYAALPDGAKWLLSFAMIAGRLELFTVMVLFAPNFWRG